MKYKSDMRFFEYKFRSLTALDTGSALRLSGMTDTFSIFCKREPQFEFIRKWRMYFLGHPATANGMMTVENTDFGQDLIAALEEVRAHRRGEIQLKSHAFEVMTASGIKAILKEPRGVTHSGPGIKPTT